MDKDFLQAFASVQNELKAPKNQYNSFGNYKYRSCEDILEAAKPLLKKYGMVLVLNDEPVVIGDRCYIKATATVYTENCSHSVTGYAREAIKKGGMDESQITGAASSYARKYALNGLFCIDDTKDADANENRIERENREEKEKIRKKDESAQSFVCSDCGQAIVAVNYKDRVITPESCAASTHKRFGKVLCFECARKQHKED